MFLEQLVNTLSEINWGAAVYIYIMGSILLFPLAIIMLFSSYRKRRVALNDAEEKLSEQEMNSTQQIDKIKTKYASIISIEDEVEKERQLLSKVANDLEGIKNEFNTKRPLLDELKKQMAVLDDKLALSELGVYEPSFYFDDSEDFKDAIYEVKEEQKYLIQDKNAVICTTQWTVDGSLSKGETMSNRHIRLTLRAYNNECAAAIANVNWNNANAMLKRIENARTQIDKANKSNHVVITDHYHKLKLKELRLTHEYREKRQEERELAREVARQERDEQRLIREAERAEKEEENYRKLLEKVKADAGLMTEDEHKAKIEELQKQLDAAHEKTERAMAMAEKTKSGFVYIISNIGSFGEDVVKIGLTRRVDPFDRVKELGDASVPFLFDTHAMIYSDDAPALEDALHKEFGERRINMSNMRKEFFKVELHQVEEAVKRLAPTANFFKDVEAREFKETILKRAEKLSEQSNSEPELPSEI